MTEAQAKRGQAEAFEEAARALGCNEDEEAFNAALRKVGRAKPLLDRPVQKDEPAGESGVRDPEQKGEPRR